MTWPQLREHAAEKGLPLNVVAAEALHVLILDALFSHPRSQGMAFQGGTCLHLVHGGYRFSEDLDLAGETLDAEAAREIVSRARAEIERSAVQLLGAGDHGWREPRPGERPVRTYWYGFTPSATGSRLRVKLELARFPAYQVRPLPVRSELDLLRRRPLVRALLPEELLAEKVAAVLGRPYLKDRDLFDIWYLVTALAADLNAELLRDKVRDYSLRLTAEHVADRLRAVRSVDLEAEMSRFLPQRHRRSLAADGYATLREAALSTLHRGLDALGLSAADV